jgi:arginyl-tRNA synthetase
VKEIQKILQDVIKAEFDQDVEVELQRTDEQFGDYATNIALQLAKKVQQNPKNIAQRIVTQIVANQPMAIQSIEVAGPGFINIRVTSVFAAQIAAKQRSAHTSIEIGKGKIVVCEFPSPNMAKPYSVGHLPAAVYGWSIHQLMRRMGYRVITDNHLGDYGTPFGKWVVGFLKYSSEDLLNKKGIYELARVYIEITAALKQEKERGETNLAKEVQSWLKKLESGDVEAVDYSRRFNQLSLDHMHRVMNRLHIKTDYELGESFYVQRGQSIVESLLKNKVAHVSSDAVIVPLDEFGIDVPAVIRKANGAALYATTDLATVEYRQQQWSPEKVFIHTGQEQAFYFKQLKALSTKAGYQDVIVHLWHGLIDQIDTEGNRTKMSSRQGVVLLEDLLDTAEDKVRSQSKAQQKEDIQAIALAAVKFPFFVGDRKNGALFDWDTMFNVQGFSGPAIQYAAVRIRSILQKAPKTKPDIHTYDWKEEHRLILSTLQYPSLLEELHATYELHRLAAYLYELTRAFNRYYEKVRILDANEPARANRIWLISLIEEILSDGLDILGIPTPKQM